MYTLAGYELSWLEVDAHEIRGLHPLWRRVTLVSPHKCFQSQPPRIALRYIGSGARAYEVQDTMRFLAVVSGELA